VLTRPIAFELSIDHNSHLSAKSLSFLHRVSGDDDSTVLSLGGNSRNDVPHESLGLRIDTSTWLI
jgi:hypothetical protein